MHDDLSNLLRYNSAIAQEANEVAFRLRQNLVSFQQSIEAIFEKHGAQVYTEPGEAYSAQRQRALRTEPTEDAAKDRLICERLRKGFEYEGKVLRPEIVVIYKYTGSTNQPTKEM
jgi:molecular chaperone GrpE (heat shock protein)